MPVQATDIDQEIAYILTNWIQNNNQLITGTIGQNVVWNLAQFIKQNPENYQKASVVVTNVNYTPNVNECIIIFTNNSTGGLTWIDNRWNKYYFVNITNNIRTFFNGKFYYDINGATQTTLAARSTLFLAKGEDDYWYQISSNTGVVPPNTPPLIGVAGRGGPNDPVIGSTLFQSPLIVGLGSTNIIDGKNCIEIVVNKAIENNYELTPDFDYDPVAGLIDRDPNEYQEGDTINISLTQ